MLASHATFIICGFASLPHEPDYHTLYGNATSSVVTHFFATSQHPSEQSEGAV